MHATADAQARPYSASIDPRWEFAVPSIDQARPVQCSPSVTSEPSSGWAASPTATQSLAVPHHTAFSVVLTTAAALTVTWRGTGAAPEWPTATDATSAAQPSRAQRRH